MFEEIPRNIWRHSGNVWRHSPECLATFPRTFEDISWNVFRTFPAMFGDIPRKVWRYSPEYNIPPIPRVPFPVPVFLVLYIAFRNLSFYLFNQNQKEFCNAHTQHNFNLVRYNKVLWKNASTL